MPVIRLYKYLSINKPETWNYRRQLIAERQLYFPDPSKFNDPLDCNIAAAVSLTGALHKCKVFCLSTEKCIDFLMFAHYADGHRGFRLTFEVDTDLNLDEIGIFGHGREVIYVNNFPKNFDLSNIHKSLFIKLDCWSYEGEYRILAKENNRITYDEDRLVEVAFGCKMNQDFEPVIRDWIGHGEHRRVKFVRARLSSNPDGYNYVAA